MYHRPMDGKGMKGRKGRKGRKGMKGMKGMDGVGKWNEGKCQVPPAKSQLPLPTANFTLD